MKTLKILKSTFSYRIHNYMIDFVVEYNMAGKVFGVKPFMCELPLIAQRLILGEALRPHLQKIEHFEKLFPLILPLGIVNQDHFFKTEFAEFYKKINDELSTNGIPINKLFEYAEKGSLAYYIFYYNQQNPINSFNYLTHLIEKGNTAKITKSTRILIRHLPQFSLKLISLIMPFVNHYYYKSELLQMLENYKTPQVRKYLQREMRQCKTNHVLQVILHNLSLYELDLPVQNDLIELFQNSYVNHTNKISILRMLKQFPNDRTISFCNNILSNDIWLHWHVGRLLHEIGHPLSKLEA